MIKLSGLKTLCLSILLVIVSIGARLDLAITHPLMYGTPDIPQAFIAQTPGSNSTPQESQPNKPTATPEMLQDDAANNRPAADSQTLNRKLENERISAPSPPQAKPPQSNGPYDMKAIQEFYKSLYGS